MGSETESEHEEAAAESPIVTRDQCWEYLGEDDTYSWACRFCVADEGDIHDMTCNYNPSGQKLVLGTLAEWADEAPLELSITSIPDDAGDLARWQALQDELTKIEIEMMAALFGVPADRLNDAG